MIRKNSEVQRVFTATGALLLFALAAPFPAAAETLFSANITHDQETGSAGTEPLVTATGEPRPLSYGTATLILNDAQTELSLDATVFNIDITGTQTLDTNDDLSAAHIHGAAAPGANAGVRWGFFGAPDNDINPDNLLVTPFASGVGGNFRSVWNQPEGNAGTTLTAQLPDIMAGLTYLNFHTRQFPGGEIRGQITPAAIPEPGTMALLAGALPGILALRRKRQGLNG